jgi:hypothetical protein
LKVYSFKIGVDTALSETSINIFSQENLGSVVVEYTESRKSVSKFLEEEKNMDFVGIESSLYQKKMTLVDLDIRADILNYDMVVSYEPRSLSALTIQALNESLNSHLDLKVKFDCVDKLDCIIPENSRRIYNFFRLSISNTFASRNKKLSSKYLATYSSHYVDSHVPFILIPPCLSGTAEEKN